MQLLSILMSISGFIGGIISLKFIIISNQRIPKSLSKDFFHEIKKNNNSFIFEEELTYDKQEPNIFRGIFKLEGMFVIMLNLNVY